MVTDTVARPLIATISLPALAGNLRRVRQLTGGARAWAVVKANAYGHGLLNGMAGFASADGLALLEFDAAQRLRAAGWSRPLLMLEGPFEPADAVRARELDLQLTVHRPEHVDWLVAAGADRPDARFDVSLKFNCGMNRLGMRAGPFREVFARLKSLPGVRSVTLMTHFANADRPAGIAQAWPAFESACAGLDAPRSASNSAAVIDHPETHGAWVRPGIMLYGASPFADRGAADLGLRAAMRLQSRLIAVQEVPAGESIGYGSLHTVDRPTRVGVVACGYADGYPRHAPVGTPVLVDGVRTRLIGRVAMDMLMVDLTPVPDAGVDAPVELWGDALPIDEVATAAGTIGYELMCALAPRVPVTVQPLTERD